MFDTYSATAKDFLAIEEALTYVWHPKLDFIFRKKKPIRSTIVISYDSQFIYIWTQRKFPGIARRPCPVKNYYAYQVPHRFIFTEEHHYGWRAGVIPEIDALLPEAIKHLSAFSVPRISGGLLTPFTTLQKSLSKKHNPYTTRESYLATIIHEFGHVYWSSYKLWWPSNKQENLRYLTTARKFYSNKGSAPNMPLSVPTPYGIGEVFAHCSEHYASQLFWPLHKQNFDKFAKNRLKDLLVLEKKKNLDQEDSVLEPTKYPHDLALVFCKLLFTCYPKTWPKMLLTKPELRGTGTMWREGHTKR